jgi:alanine racemase
VKVYGKRCQNLKCELMLDNLAAVVKQNKYGHGMAN